MGAYLRTFSLMLGIGILVLNLYGLTQTLRPDGLSPDVLRFKENDLVLTEEEFRTEISRKNGENDQQYARRLTILISKGMAHVHWELYDPATFNQRIPIWDNYILFAIGLLSNNADFTRYHFTIPDKSIERGVGLCGDASMLLSELLFQENIQNQIISMPGHVMVEAQYGEQKQLLDPDFGVPLDNSFEYYVNNTDQLVKEYESFGYFNNGELMIRREISDGLYLFWNGAKHFVTKKYYFERLSYVMKWLIPFFLICAPLWFFAKKNRKKTICF